LSALPVRRQTIAEMTRGRSDALALFGRAHQALKEAYALLSEAWHTVPGAGRQDTSYNRGDKEKAAALLPVVTVPTEDDFLASARYLVDRQCWAHIVSMTDLERLMDKKAKDEFRQQLMTDAPEFTTGNVTATLERFMLDADTIFKRGLAEAFSNLDRRFRSHDGWKIGSRIILNRAFDEHGSWSFYSNKRDTLQDIERVFFLLDKDEKGESKPVPPQYAGIVGAIDESRNGRGWCAKQSESESDYFIARAFLNGNLHIWFKRDDLLEKVNRLLGEYYGAPIPEERAADEDTGLNDPKTTLAKNYGFFASPDEVADRVIGYANLRQTGSNAEPLLVLEPSAGTGNLARRCVEQGSVVRCCEIHPERAAQLRAQEIYVLTADFLTVGPSRTYDRVVMNPPFDRERDIDHVMHAFKFLKPGGRLVSVMSAGTEFRETKKSAAFRKFVEERNGTFVDLPPRSFASVGTNCNTVILIINEDGRRSSW